MSEPLPEYAADLFAALDGSPDAVFVTDRLNRIVFWNVSAERLFGYSAGEALGLSCASTLLGCDGFGNRYCSDSCPITQMATRGESVRNFELRFAAKDGHDLQTEVSVLHVPAPTPERFFLVHVVQTASRRPETPSGNDGNGNAPPRPTLVSVRESDDARARKLTSREVEVLALLAAGNPTAEIASRLHISNLTARNHIQNILDKLEVHSKTEAVAFAFQKHLV